MSIFLSKLAAVFVYPLGVVVLALVLVFVGTWIGFRRTSMALLLATIVGLWVAATPAVSSLLTASLENQYPPITISALPHADVGIILGGVMSPALPPRMAAELGDPVDRVMHGARIFRAGKVNFLLVSGGNLPWQPGGQPEALLIAELLVELGVPARSIVLETESRNTRENATNSAAIMKARGWARALLVTSATHMPRASAAFERAGVDVMPVTTDVHVRWPLYDSVLDFLPDAGALAGTTNAIKEWIGLVVYRIRGWA